MENYLKPEKDFWGGYLLTIIKLAGYFVLSRVGCSSRCDFVIVEWKKEHCFPS